MKITEELIEKLAANGYIDDERLIAAATDADGAEYVLCINGELVTLAAADGQKIMRDSIDRLGDLTIKSGLFKKTVCFANNGREFSLTVKGGKNVIEYFRMIG